MECPRCGGTGTCAECQGSGQVVCPVCDGRGKKTTPRGTTYDCKTCQGNGKMECSPLCASCDGKGQITEQFRRQVLEKYRTRWDNTAPLSRFSSLLLAINAAIYLMQLIFPKVNSFLGAYCFNTADGWLHGEVWRLVTPMFLHGGLVHLAFNCWFLASYCPALEGFYGSRRFLVLYLSSGILGNLFSWVGNCWVDKAAVAGIGASGALFGVGAAFVALHYRFHLLSRSQIQPWAIYLLGYLGLGFAAGLNILGARVDNWAHLGGFVGGFLFVWLTRRPEGR